MHKATVHRFLATMENLGIVEKVGQRYRLGLRLFELGNRVPIRAGLVDQAHPFLEELAGEIQETVNLAGLFRGEVMYLDKVQCRRSLQINTYIGCRILPHCTALGKAILAYLPGDVRRRILAEKGLQKRTPYTITDLGLLESQLAEIRRRGYSVDDQEFEEGLRCVAVPLFSPDHQIAAAISASGPTVRINERTIPRLAEKLKEAASRIQMRMQDFRAPL